MSTDDKKKPGIPLREPDDDADLPLVSDWKPAKASKRSEPPAPAAAAPPDTPPKPKPMPRPRPADFSPISEVAAESDRRAARPQPQADPATGGEEKPLKVCPKCGEVNTDFQTCRRCGLMFMKWTPAMERRLYAALAPETLDQLRTLWKAVQDAPTPEARKAALDVFHRYASDHNAHTFAAARYRTWLGLNPEDAAVAALLDTLTRQALMMIPEPKRDKDESISKTTLIIGIVAGVILTALFTLLFLNYFETL